MTAERKPGTSSFFVDGQLPLVNSMLERIVPPDEGGGKMPGAGELGVADFVDRVVGESAELKRLFTRGLAQIEIASQTQHSKDFVDLSSQQKDTVLKNVETQEPEFFRALVRQTYNGYYTNARVIELLGLEGRPPQPRGYELEQGDFSLIENVKKRGQAYRDA